MVELEAFDLEALSLVEKPQRLGAKLVTPLLEESLDLRVIRYPTRENLSSPTPNRFHEVVTALGAMSEKEIEIGALHSLAVRALLKEVYAGREFTYACEIERHHDPPPLTPTLAIDSIRSANYSLASVSRTQDLSGHSIG
jgi:hypothetical protein